MRNTLNISVLLLMMVFKVNGQLFQQDSIPQYDFVRYDLNRLSVKDSTTLGSFFEKLWVIESKDSTKARILHIGDSHIQAGYFSGKVRECLHKGLGCGTRERGFVFPFGMAHTNGPVNYGAKYTGVWKGFKSSSNITHSDWGLSGISASTQDDSTTLKIYSNNHTFDAYRFNKVRLFFKDTAAAFKISMKANGIDSVLVSTDDFGCFKTFDIQGTSDTIYFTFTKDSLDVKSGFILQGVDLLSDFPGLSYSEVGVNGAKVKSFLRCQDFSSQLATVNPDLIILSLGTNDAYNLSFNDSIFYHYYDSLISIVKASAPNSSIILTTPGDAKRYRKTLMKENLVIRKSILQLAKKHNTAVWDFFNIMGGYGSINKWYDSKLSSADRLHFNEKGYHLQGDLFYAALANAYNNYTAKRRVKPMIINEGVDYEKLITGIFVHNPKEPMFFSHYLFWIFFSAFFLIYAFVYKNLKARSIYLFAISLFFYYKAGGFYFSLLILSTLIDYFIGNKIYNSVEESRKKSWLTLSVVLNLSLLFFFKYTGFFVDSINQLLGTNLKSYNVFAGIGNLFSSGNYDISLIILPVGISFYTFQTISYSVDIYREKIKPVASIFDFGFYVSFFPQLVAGPIVRANEFIPQIYKPYKLSYQDFSRACILIIGGLFKKMVISDYISTNFVDRVFESPLKYSGFENLMGAYGYTIQIYCDFSGYSDIAIGLALLLGFSLPVNFNKPYLSTNITDFWRRWHISLSSWLRDYLYIPLGGNRKGKVRTYINLFVTMLLGGLWHGAALKFIIWGGLHGGALAIHKGFSARFPKLANSKNWGYKFLGWAFTFHFVVFCWVFFRASNWESIKQIFNQILFNFDWTHVKNYLTAPEYVTIFTVVFLGYIIHILPDKFEVKVQNVFANKWWPTIGVVSILTIIFIYQFKSSEIQPFIYFQF